MTYEVIANPLEFLLGLIGFDLSAKCDECMGWLDDNETGLCSRCFWIGEDARVNAQRRGNSNFASRTLGPPAVGVKG